MKAEETLTIQVTFAELFQALLALDPAFFKGRDTKEIDKVVTDEIQTLYITFKPIDA